MGVCVFSCDEIIPCVEHALNSKEWGMGYETELTPAPALFFVHDQGVYCMSNGIPAQLLPGEDKRMLVAYARGCDPNAGVPFDDWYETARALVGGDDFAETLSATPRMLELCRAYTEMHVDVSPTTISVCFAVPRENNNKEDVA